MEGQAAVGLGGVLGVDEVGLVSGRDGGRGGGVLLQHHVGLVAGQEAVVAVTLVGCGDGVAVVVAEGEPAGVAGVAVELDVDPGALAGEDGVVPGEGVVDAVLGVGVGVAVLADGVAVLGVGVEGGKLEGHAAPLLALGVGEVGEGELAAVGAGLDEGEEGDAFGVVGPADDGVGVLVQAHDDMLVVGDAEGHAQGGQLVKVGEVEGLHRVLLAGGEADGAGEVGRAGIAGAVLGPAGEDVAQLLAGGVGEPGVAEGDIAEGALDGLEAARAGDRAGEVAQILHRGPRVDNEGTGFATGAADAVDDEAALQGAAAGDDDKVVGLGRGAILADDGDRLRRIAGGFDGAALQTELTPRGGGHVEVGIQFEGAGDGEVERGGGVRRARGEAPVEGERAALGDVNDGVGAFFEESRRGGKGHCGRALTLGGADLDALLRGLDDEGLAGNLKGTPLLQEGEGLKGIRIILARENVEIAAREGTGLLNDGGVQTGCLGAEHQVTRVGHIAVEDEGAGLGGQQVEVLRGQGLAADGRGELQDPGGRCGRREWWWSA